LKTSGVVDTLQKPWVQQSRRLRREISMEAKPSPLHNTHNHTHTTTNTLNHTQIQTRTHTNMHPHSHSLSLTHIHALSHAHTHTHTHTLSQYWGGRHFAEALRAKSEIRAISMKTKPAPITHTIAHKPPHIHTYTRTHTCTHVRTRTHTHTDPWYHLTR